MCSGRSLPPLAPPVVTPTAPRDWGNLVPPPLVAAPDAFIWLSLPDQRRLPGAPTSVYHPPRAASPA